MEEIVLIPDALELATLISHDMGLDLGEKELLSGIAKCCPLVDAPEGKGVYVRDLDSFTKNFIQSVRYKDFSYMRQPRGLCVNRVVGVQEFIESREYMDQASSCRPLVMDGLIELFESKRSAGYVECVLSGSTGWGKTYFSYLAIAYMIYKLSCYHSPQIEYELAPGTSLVFIQQSKRYELAKKVLFGQFVDMLKLSPYFSKVFPFDQDIHSELRFPKSIYVLPVGGADSAALGMNVFGGVIDEMNFMTRVKESERFDGVATDQREYDQAEKLYTVLIRRMKGRFMQKGKLPGKLLLVSSVNYPNDFTSRKVEEAKTDKTILAIAHAQWEALPKDRFSGEVFYVEVGNEVKGAKILKNKSEAVDEDDVVEVPVEYRSDFDRDLNAALRDYAGVTTGSAHPFIPFPERIVKAHVEYEKITGGRTLFKRPEVVISRIVDPENPDWENLVDLSYIEECILDTRVPFAVHFDPAISEDAAGLAVTRIYDYIALPEKKVIDPKTKNFVETKSVNLPVYMVDGVLRIIPPSDGTQIDLELVRDLVLWLRGYIYVKWATMDSYQSAMMIQSFRRAKMKSGVLSVDTSMDPYTELKLAIKDERIYYPKHPTLIREIREVEKERYKDKINHPDEGSKDVSDSVAGSIFILRQKEAVVTRRSGRDRRHASTDPESRRRRVPTVEETQEERAKVVSLRRRIRMT